MKIKLYQGDLPDGLDLGPVIAIDTETLGLNPQRDRLCLAQLSSGDGVCHAVQFAAGSYAAPNLKKLLADPKVTKLFHFARFDGSTTYRSTYTKEIAPPGAFDDANCAKPTFGSIPE